MVFTSSKHGDLGMVYGLCWIPETDVAGEGKTATPPTGKRVKGRLVGGAQFRSLKTIEAL